MTVFAAEDVLWAGATVRLNALRVQFAKKLVGDDGPSIDTDAEPVAFSQHAMPAGTARFAASPGGERRGR